MDSKKKYEEIQEEEWRAKLEAARLEVPEYFHQKYCNMIAAKKNFEFQLPTQVLTDDKTLQLQPHYDNSDGSWYQFAENKGLNSWEFDIIKRVGRCRKKGSFIEDLKKTKDLIDLYIAEQGKNFQ